uniref:Class I SAM-dependent methyltransferase n=1 Tax=Bosea sp. NBC_00436 TaxID=2969620 RepID=A0A9E8CSC9_9HYPH
MADSKPCPICHAKTFLPTGKKADIVDVLDRWEAATSVRFPDDVRETYSRERFPDITLWSCQTCGFGRFDPPCAGDAGFYEAISAQDYYVHDKWEFELAIEDLDRVGARRVIDVGCGSGAFIRLLRQSRPALEVEGYEITPVLVESLRAQGVKMLTGTLDEVTRTSSSIPPFDAVCMFQVLEHTPDPVAFFDTFAPLVRRGGWIIVSTPDEGGPISEFWNALTELPPHHVSKWTEAAYRTLLEERGFRVERVRREPLADYLWDSYLPPLWDKGIWPSLIFDPAARSRNMTELNDRVRFGINCLKAAGLKRLPDVPGHTIYVLAQRI